MRKYQFLFNALIIFFTLTTIGFSQDPTPQPTPPDTDITVITEEIKLNISAVTNSGDTALGLTPKDVVISENGRLHQATSVRKIPANVLFVLDVGNEIAYAKRNRVTAETSRNLVNALHEDDSIAVIQYGDKVEFLSKWTKDKNALNKTLANNKLGFGRHSRFNLAMETAIEYFDKTPVENRHLILITDGIDTLDKKQKKNAITKKLLSSDINVHVISYTLLQKQSIEGKKVPKGRRVNRAPQAPGIGPPEGFPPTGGLLSINLDREMINHRKKEAKRITESENYLVNLAKDTNGEIFIPETLSEMMDKTGRIAKYIDSQYIATYIPNKALAESPDGEVRNIKVTSKKSGVYIQSSRKYVVSKEK